MPRSMPTNCIGVNWPSLSWRERKIHVNQSLCTRANEMVSSKKCVALDPAHTYSQEGVQSSVLHELSEDHDGAAGCYYAFQVDNVGMLELAHDWGFRQEVPPLLISVSTLKSLNGNIVLLLPRNPQPSTTDFSKLAWEQQNKWLSFGNVSSKSFFSPNKLWL